MTNPSKKKGTAAETAVVDYLRQFTPFAERRALAGSSDRGDISGVLGAVIEVKNCPQRMRLGEWIEEVQTEVWNAMATLGAVWHKRAGRSSPGDWYVTMTGSQFVQLLEEAGRIVKHPEQGGEK